MSRAEQPNFQEGVLGDIRKLGTPVQEAVQVPTGEVRGKGFFDRVLRHPYREVYKLEDSQGRGIGEAEVVNERLVEKKGEKARQEMKIFNSQEELQRIDTTIYDPIKRKVDLFEMVDVKTGLPIKEVHREERWGGRFVVKNTLLIKHKQDQYESLI